MSCHRTRKRLLLPVVQAASSPGPGPARWGGWRREGAQQRPGKRCLGLARGLEAGTERGLPSSGEVGLGCARAADASGQQADLSARPVCQRSSSGPSGCGDLWERGTACRRRLGAKSTNASPVTDFTPGDTGRHLQQALLPLQDFPSLVSFYLGGEGAPVSAPRPR